MMYDWKTKLPAMDAVALERFDAYYRLLIEKNRVMNLTAITEPEDVAVKHFADSLAALPYLRPNMRIVDVGTGAGFPAIPLLIANPALSFTLLDALQKRLTFVETVLRELGLSATLVHLRAEDAGRDARHRERYDAAVARAVAPLPALLEYAVPLLRVGGTAIAYKGEPQEELQSARSAARLLSVTLTAVPVASEAGARSLILAKKTAPTGKAYPRKAGTPQKEPL